jgi:flavodoxin
MKVLIVFYSRTGHTRLLAERLAEALQGTLAPITERRSRAGFRGYLRSAWEAWREAEPSIRAVREKPRDFDLLLVGTPIWSWKLASPVRAFARAHAKGVKRVAFFCTMGASGALGAFGELETIYGRRAEAALALTEAELADIDGAIPQRKIAQFVSRLRAADEAKSAGKLAA